jgi:two-component system sensor histidine kinase PilS (NtrC family)
VQFSVDLLTIIMLMHASGGIESGFGNLLIVSIGTLALLVRLDQALFLCALGALALLGEQTFSYIQRISSIADFAAAGVLGAVLFVFTAVVQLLRNRMVESEQLAAQRGVDLQNLVELNEYIIRHLRESIVVVDGEDRIRLLNESAAALLGAKNDARDRRLTELSSELSERLQRWRDGAEQSSVASFVIESDPNATKLDPHFARLGADRSDGVVIFLEDTSLIFERVQQTKLAALGRLSASIAHEIRNPLGALSHAGQLLAESASLRADDQRLTEIIRVNSDRVSRIVDSVLALSRGDKIQPERIDLKAWASDFADEFVRTQELFEGTASVNPEARDVSVEMDRTHLHQVVWNLCDNAVKYASAAAGGIAVDLYCGTMEASRRPYLDVIDSGPGIDPDRVEQIFEPFFTAQPGGTGLGLYISRELCERNGANLRYLPRAGGGSVFRIVFADPDRWEAG